MKQTCLLLKTKDGRKFLTYEKNLPSLIEFAKTFGAEIYRVEIEKQKILELKALANAICDQEYATSPKHRRIEKIHPKPKRTRQAILRNAIKIRKFIRRRLLAGKPVSLKELKTKYKHYEMTDACLCNHLSTIRKLLIREGYTIKKLGAGKYCVLD